MSTTILTHGRSGPLSGRLERLVARAEAECRADDIARRLDAREAAIAAGEPVRTCTKCGIYLLPGEITECRHCAAGKPRTDPE